MSIRLKSAIAIAAMGLAAAAAQAATAGVSVLGSSAVVNNASFAADGFTPANTTFWQNNSAWWNGSAATIDFKLDQAYRLSSATVTLDWNDVYRFSVSNDGVNYTTLFTTSGLFDQPVGTGVQGGQVTLPVSFAATADAYSFVRVQALYGDGMYSVGEVSFSGVAAAVPEPSSVALMLAGAGLLGAVARRRRAR